MKQADPRATIAYPPARYITKHEEQTDTLFQFLPTLPGGEHGRPRDYRQTRPGGRVRNRRARWQAGPSRQVAGPPVAAQFAMGVPAVLALSASPLVSAAAPALLPGTTGAPTPRGETAPNPPAKRGQWVKEQKRARRGVAHSTRIAQSA